MKKNNFLLIGYSHIARKRIIEVFLKNKIEFSVASKSFKEKIKGVKKQFLNYEDALLNSDANIVYISLPNALHFYWAKKNNDLNLIAAVDCTGHGVPGAFMSFIGANGLNAAVDEKQLANTGKILDELNNSVHKSLNKATSEENVRDGMDLSLCSFDLKNMKLDFSGAKNAIYLIRDGSLTQHKGDKIAVGSFIPGEQNFSNKEIDLQKGDQIYLFSDGYPDQFGGLKGKKFMYKQFREKITEFSILSMKDQKTRLEQTMDAWMGSFDQIDDILIIGIKI